MVDYMNELCDEINIFSGTVSRKNFLLSLSASKPGWVKQSLISLSLYMHVHVHVVDCQLLEQYITCTCLFF